MQPRAAYSMAETSSSRQVGVAGCLRSLEQKHLLPALKIHCSGSSERLRLRIELHLSSGGQIDDALLRTLEKARRESARYHCLAGSGTSITVGPTVL